MRVELPDGGWADFADPVTVSEGKRRPVKKASYLLYGLAGPGVFEDRVGVTPDVSDAMDALNDAVVVALIDKWSYPYDVTIDGLLKVPGPAYDKLREATAPFVIELLPNYGPNPEPGSPT